MASRFLTHVNDDQLDLQLDDHWFRMVPGEPFEVESSFYADKLMEIYGGVYGLVELDVTRSRIGISVDIDKGIAAAKKALRASYSAAVRQYVDVQMVDRIRKGLPALPPQGRAAHAIQVLKIDLKKRYGFAPLDFDLDGADLSVASIPQSLPVAVAADPRIELFEHKLSKQDRIIAAMAKALGVDPSEFEDDDEAESEAGTPRPKRERKPKVTDQPVQETANV